MEWVRKAFWGGVWVKRIRWRGRWHVYLGKQYSWQREQHMQIPDWHFWETARSPGWPNYSKHLASGRRWSWTHNQGTDHVWLKTHGKNFEICPARWEIIDQGKWVKYFFFTPFYFAYVSVQKGYVWKK